MPVDARRRRPATGRHAHAAVPDDALELEDAVTALELEAELTMRGDDLAAGLVPPDVTRSLHPHELRARTSFAAIDDGIIATTGAVTRRLVDDRARFMAMLRADLEGRRTGQAVVARILDLDGPAGLAAVPGAAGLFDAATADVRRLLDQAAAAGASRALSEAALQGLAGLPAIAPLDDVARGHLDQLARRAAVGPHVDLVRALREHAVATATPAVAEDLVAGLERHAATLAQSPLEGYARTAAASADGLGRQAAAQAGPTPIAVYASELLDRATCGPCSLIDGTRYPNLEAAVADYPTGIYARCDGGPRCRGTLVFVWSDEAPPTLLVPGDRPLPGAGGPGGPPRPGTPVPPPIFTPPTAGIVLPPLPAAPAVLTRDEALARERDARLQARRLRAAEDRAAEADALVDLEREGWTADEVAEARKTLDHYRARARLEARAAGDAALAELDRLGGGLLKAPPRAKLVLDPVSGRRLVRRFNPDGSPFTGGEWDWLDNLSESELKRLRRHWVRGDDAMAPDQLADIINGATSTAQGVGTIDEAMARWLDLNRVADAADAMAKGKLPSINAYGNLNPDALIADSPLDAGTLFGADVQTAVRHVLERHADDAAEFAARYGDDALDVARGPAPWDMTEASFVDELEAIDRTYLANPNPVVDHDPGLGRPRYAPDVEEALGRLGELIPAEFQALDLSGADLHRTIVAWARHAGLKVERFRA